jgi:hypothetical protein
MTEGRIAFHVRPMGAKWSIENEIAGEPTRETFDRCLKTGAQIPAIKEPVIEWADTLYVAALDIDYHGDKRPELWRVKNLMACVSIPARWWWITKSGGIRIICFGGGGLNAEETAAASYFALRTHCLFTSLPYPTGVEIKSCTRMPPGEVYSQHGSVDDTIRKLRNVLNEYRDVSESEVDDWLDDHGMERGKRYSHQLCPINPTNDDKRDCVLLGPALGTLPKLGVAGASKTPPRPPSEHSRGWTQ